MKCKICSDKFKAKYFLQKTCLNPSCILAWSKEVKEKTWKKEKKERKEKLKTKSDHLNELQKIFNKFIRERDTGNLCISCQKKPSKKNAGHFKSVGACPELRFEELNAHLQCEYCNTHLHGNIIEYRKNLINKIGIEKVEWLEGYHEPKKYSSPEIKEMKEYYKGEIKKLTK